MRWASDGDDREWTLVSQQNVLILDHNGSQKMLDT